MIAVWNAVLNAVWFECQHTHKEHTTARHCIAEPSML